MFGFMKKHSEKEREEKERKKKEKKDKKAKMEKPLTQEELERLEEAKRGLYGKGGDNFTYQPTRPPRNGQQKGPTPSGSSDSLNSRETTPDAGTYTSVAKVDISRTVQVPPPVKPKPKKGILKGRSNYGPEIPNMGVRGHLDDTVTLEENTNLNEILSGEMPSPEEKKKEAEKKRKALAAGIQPETQSGPTPPRRGPPSKPTLHSRTPPRANPPPPPERESTPDDELDAKIPFEDTGPPSPAEKIYANIDLQLPSVAPPRCLKPRALELKRLPAGDFGFTLRRGTVLERGGKYDKTERKRTVIFAEPGPKNTHTGLLPGDRLIEVNGVNVEAASREEIIELIKKSTHSVMLKVQPIPELSELSMRSGLEGEDVPIGESGIQGGTLKRSGSMRFKTRQAKSEEQLACEQSWLRAERTWLVHKGGFAAGRMLKPGEEDHATSEDAAGKVKVKLDFGGEVLEVDEEDVEKCNPPQYDRVEDLANLRYLNESSLLHTLRQRYGSNLVHTYAGQSLVIVNPMHPLSIYSEKVIHMFKGCKPEDMPPHIYATGQSAYRNLLNTRRDQSIVFLGRSGAGKTTNARHLMHYLNVAAGSINNFLTVDKLNWIFALLDAFGNSRTIMNTNATRYTQLVSLDFDHTGQIGGASFQVLMLEKMRIAKRPEGEPTFHVFYQMLAGVDAVTRKELQLENMNEPNLFMTPLQRAEDRQKAAASWNKILQAFAFLSMTEDEVKAMVAALAAIYHLGVAGTVKGSTNKYQFGRPAAAQRAAAVLGTTVEELARNIFNPKANIRGSPGAKDPNNGAENLTGLEALEGFVVGLYAEVFSALVALINRSLSTNYRTTSSINVLDTPGFQNPASCGRPSGGTFDDMCHNYAQERLQLLYHDIMFTSKQDLYAQESIDCDFEMVTSSPAAIVSLLDTPGPQSIVRPGASGDKDQRGLLWLLDEEAIFPGATEESLLERLKMNHASSSDKRDALVKRGNGKMTFTLNHFQGTNPVMYNTKGWLKACRENPIGRGVNAFLQDSQKKEIATLFSSIRVPGSTSLTGSIVGLEPGATSSLRRASSMRRSYTATSLKRKSVCLQLKVQVDTIIESLRRTHVHFVHCLLPQHNAGLSDLRTSQVAPNKAAANEDVMMNVPLVRSQVRGLEITEAIRIHRQGFPEHMLYPEFRRRFDFLASPEHRSGYGDVVDEKAAVEKLLTHLEIDKTSYRTGLSQVRILCDECCMIEMPVCDEVRAETCC